MWATVILAGVGCADTDSSPKDSAEDTGQADTGGAPDSDSAQDSQPEETGAPDTDVAVRLTDTATVKLFSDEISFIPWPVAVSAAGDVDGDGHADVILGRAASELGGTRPSGAAYLILGPIEGDRALSAADARLIGEDGECAGQSVDGAGDIDADGFDDLVVGAPCGHDDTAHPNLQTGQVRIVLGPVNGDLDLVASDATLVGEVVYSEKEQDTHSGNAQVGQGVADAGDVNGDGLADVLVGGPYYDYGDGIAYLVSGPMTGELDLATQAEMPVTTTSPGNLGSGVASAGDTNGDGLADIVIGRHGDPDACTLVFVGPASGDLVPSDADGIATDSLDGLAGQYPRSAGDVNADGYDDLLVQAQGFDGGTANSGAAFVFLGPLTRTVDTADARARLEGVSGGTGLSAADGPGDVNGDGFDDVIVGVYDASPAGPGTTYVQFGPMSGTSSLADASVVIHGEGGQDQSGETVAGAGDIDGDGLADILVGGGGDEEGGENAGAAWLVFGSQMR